MRYRFTAMILSAGLLAGCTPVVRTYRIDPDGHVTNLGTVPADEHWQQLVAELISQELRGEPPAAGHSSWETFWPWWYANILREPKPPWRSSEFKTTRDLVDYIKQQ